MLTRLGKRVYGALVSSKIFRPVLALVCASWLVHTTSVRDARAEGAIDGIVVLGVDQDVSGIGRLIAGGLYTLEKIGLRNAAVEAHIGLDAFLRINSDKGVTARSLNLLDVGIRYGLTKQRFVGPYLAAGGNFGIFVAAPHERKIQGDMELCASAMIDEDQPQDECTYRIDKSVSARFGLGWGFRSGKKTTVGIRLDFTYWLFSLNDFEDQPKGAPIPRRVERPQSSYSFLVGFEFMRWGSRTAK